MCGPTCIFWAKLTPFTLKSGKKEKGGGKEKRGSSKDKRGAGHKGSGGGGAEARRSPKPEEEDRTAPTTADEAERALREEKDTTVHSSQAKIKVVLDD